MHGGHELARDPSNTPSAGQLGRNALKRHDSVVCAQTPLAGPEAVLGCLSRYSHRVAVSNERSLSRDTAGARLRVCAYNQGGKRVISIDGPEFMGRSLQHALPSGFKRIMPLLPAQPSPALKTERMATGRAALNLPAASAPAREDAAEFLKRVARIDATRCAHCALATQVRHLRHASA